MSGEQTRTKTTSFRLAEELYGRMTDYSKHHGIPVNVVMNKALSGYLKHLDKVYVSERLRNDIRDVFGKNARRRHPVFPTRDEILNTPKTSKTKKKAVSFRLKAGLWMELKNYCEREKKTMGEVAEESIEAYLKSLDEKGTI